MNVLLFFQLTKGYARGGTNKTLFINKFDKDFIVAQIYVDDMIFFGGFPEEIVNSFIHNMQSEFAMSMFGELTFFFGLQIKQEKNGIFIS